MIRGCDQELLLDAVLNDGPTGQNQDDYTCNLHATFKCNLHATFKCNRVLDSKDVTGRAGCSSPAKDGFIVDRHDPCST